MVKTENASQYMKDGKYTIDNIKGKTFSFVSTSSTSGFVFPSNVVKAYFKKQEGFGDKKVEDLFLEGGNGKFFSNVLFGQSHQGSLLNVPSPARPTWAPSTTSTSTSVPRPRVGHRQHLGRRLRPSSRAPPLPSTPFPPAPSSPCSPPSQVKSAPIAVNTDLFTADQLKALQAALISDDAMNNPGLFLPKGATGAAIQQSRTVRTASIAADDAWYDPIRAMLK